MLAEKKMRVWPLVVTILHIINWVSATSSFFSHDDEAQLTHSFQTRWESKQSFQSKEMEKLMHDEKAFVGLSTLGSRPPRCEHKCGECNPCEAIQVPKATDRLALHYANYEPVGWKCKCGASFFNP